MKGAYLGTGILEGIWRSTFHETNMKLSNNLDHSTLGRHTHMLLPKQLVTYDETLCCDTLQITLLLSLGIKAAPKSQYCFLHRGIDPFRRTHLCNTQCFVRHSSIPNALFVFSNRPANIMLASFELHLDRTTMFSKLRASVVVCSIFM